MKKILFLIIAIVSLTACDSSDNAAPDFESAITVDGIEFIPSKASVSNSTATMPGEGALDFSLSKGTTGTSSYEAINFKINYPLISSSAPNGVYEFGIGGISETLFAQGFYVKGSTAYSLAGFTVKVTVLPNTEYRLDFQNIQAVNPLNEEMVIISGYFEGKMN